MRRINPEWAENEANNKIDLEAEYVVSWLCDPSVWNTQYKTEEAKYAIGAPSLEMWIKAYNAYLGRYQPDNYKIYCGIKNENGYGIRYAYETLNYYILSLYIDNSIEQSKVLVIPYKYQWLSSPSRIQYRILLCCVIGLYGSIKT